MSENPEIPNSLRNIPNPESAQLSGVVLSRGPESAAKFEGTVVQWRSLVSAEEQAYMRQMHEEEKGIADFDDFDKHRVEAMLSPLYVTQSMVAERASRKVKEIGSNAILVAFDGIDVTNFAMVNFCPFVCLISPAGITAHGSQLLLDASTFTPPPNFVAIGRVEAARTLKDGDKVRIETEGQRATISKI